MHNNTPYFDRAIIRLLPTVKSKFAKPSSLKGWMYFVLQRLKTYTDNPNDVKFWDDAISYWANNVYNSIDKTEGVFYQTNMANCDCGYKTIYLDKAYRVDHQVESGAALVHAGTVYNRPEWVSAGYRQVLTAYEQAFSEEYGLFGRIYLMGNSGYRINADGTKTYFDYSNFTNKLWDGQAKMGETSEEIDALLRAAEVTPDPIIKEKFIEIAIKMLDALRTLPIHDKIRGGYYQAMYIANGGEGNKAGEVVTSKKEMRQASLLGTFNLANRIIEDKNWKDLEREMFWLLTNTFYDTPKGMFLPNVEKNPSETLNGYRKSLAGYTYQLASDWNIYVSSNVAENWVSNESNSLALLGLLEFLKAKFIDGYQDEHIFSKTQFVPNNEFFVHINGNILKGPMQMNSVTIFDLVGKTVLKETNLNNTTYDISSLNKGLYIAQIVFNNGQKYTVKFIK